MSADEIVVFDPDQVLPRYLVYFERTRGMSLMYSATKVMPWTSKGKIKQKQQRRRNETKTKTKRKKEEYEKKMLYLTK